MITSTRRQRILNEVAHIVGLLLYYDRKEDDDLPLGDIEEAIKNGEITIEEMVALFAVELRKGA